MIIGRWSDDDSNSSAGWHLKTASSLFEMKAIFRVLWLPLIFYVIVSLGRRNSMLYSFVISIRFLLDCGDLRLSNRPTLDDED